MEISKGAIGILAAVCVAGGAGTAYYSSRDRSVAEPVTAAAPANPGQASPAVEQSEEVVSDVAAPAAPRDRCGPARRAGTVRDPCRCTRVAPAARRATGRHRSTSRIGTTGR
jgi:hypothetical protein